MNLVACRYGCGETFLSRISRGAHERWSHGGVHPSARPSGDGFDAERPRVERAVHAKASDKWPGRP